MSDGCNWRNWSVYHQQGINAAGHDTKTARTVAIRWGETLNAPVPTAMFNQIDANNRAGGLSKLKGGQSVS